MATELPRNGKLLALAQEHVTDQSLADFLSVPRTTLRDHIYRIGMREQVNAVRNGKEVPVPEEIPTIVRDYSHESRHYVYPLGDVHLGAATCNVELWEEWLGFVQKRKNASLMGTGDFLNTAIIGSKSDVYDEKLTVGDAKRVLRGQLAPLAAEDRIDGLAPGNHENRITRATGDCPIRDVCDQLDVRYIESAAMFVYLVGSQEYRVYMRHGTGSGQSLAQLPKSGDVISADVYITGHTHKQALVPSDYFVTQGTREVGFRTVRRKRYFVSSGSFLGYERYAAERGYPPSRRGAPRIFLDGERWDVHVGL